MRGFDAAPSPATNAFHQLEVAVSIYDGGLQNGWQDSGRAPHEAMAHGPMRIRFNESGEWIVAKIGLTGSFGGLTFRVKEPPGEGEFLEIHVDSASPGNVFPRVKLKPDHRTDVGEGWTAVFVPMDDLNPKGTAFDRIVFGAFRPVTTDWVPIDRIALTKTPSGLVASSATVDRRLVSMRIGCDARATKISSLIYGVAGAEPGLRATARRWGGNATTRYNWEAHVSNRAQDWFFENKASDPYTQFLDENAKNDTRSALTIPIIGWVAKDGTSYSFPVSVFGQQAKTDPWLTDAGNGTTSSGAKIPPGPPTRTSAPAPPEWIKRWILAIRASDAKSGKRSVDQYILDNEPMLWSTTHRDVRPEPLGYDELLERTIQYGAAIRQADPDAAIAGPAEWGWSNYFYSAKDLAGIGLKIDRRSHGDVPLAEWYLRKLREHEQKTGVRVLDVFDLHYYPQEDNVYGGGDGGTDRSTALLRLRATRSLWDPSYVDESWIKDTIRLLPRMKEWIDKNYPGRGISIGEWSFGGEKDISGAIAIAETLGRFAQFGVASAFYWVAPPPGSPSSLGFLAYRNFDGKGGHFLDWYVPASASSGVSLFASRDAAGKSLVAVAINMSPDSALLTKLDLGSCGEVSSHQSYVYERGSSSFVASAPVQGGTGGFEQALPPWSIAVLDVELAHPLGGNLEK